MQLASRFASRSPVLRSERPLSDDQIPAVAPSIFADAPHESRSERYSYIPTATVLQELRGEGFEPFMVCQTRVRQDDRRDYTKHMVRLRHASQINGREANEIILLNSHDGTSSYQMLAGMFRFVCQNGLVCGDTVADVRVPHKGDVAAHVIDGAYEVLHGFDPAQESRDAMQAITLDAGESEVFARAALAWEYLRRHPDYGRGWLRRRSRPDAAAAERDVLRKEAEAAAGSSVFFRSSNPQRAAAATPTQTASAASASGLASFDPQAAGPASTAAQPADSTAMQNRQDQKEAFQKAGTTETRNSGNLQMPTSPYQVMAGTVIVAALVTGIKSDLPGDVIGRVTEPVYDTATGRYLLIPQGLRIFGKYNSQVAYGQSRVQVVWNRIILPDTSSLTLDNLAGTDPAGYAGRRMASIGIGIASSSAPS